jgi:DNA-binding LytR/AlgR family response regulator
MNSALIVDDEPLLRDQLVLRLRKLWPALNIIGTASNGAEALSLYEELRPDIVFLDIHMPVMNGLDAARMIGRGREQDGRLQRAHIVFVTAFDQHAVAAFERGAIDYVLKPYAEARLLETVQRLQERLQLQADAATESGDQPEEQNLAMVLTQLSHRLAGTVPTYLKWIKASVGQTVRLIPVEEVVYFQSDEKYTRVVLCDSEVLVRKPIKELLQELDPDRFWQIHRATIVNVKFIDGVLRGLRDQADLKLKGLTDTLVVSRNYTHLFRQM